MSLIPIEIADLDGELGSVFEYIKMDEDQIYQTALFPCHYARYTPDQWRDEEDSFKTNKFYPDYFPDVQCQVHPPKKQADTEMVRMHVKIPKTIMHESVRDFFFQGQNSVFENQFHVNNHATG